MTKCKRIPDLENKKCKKTLYLQKCKKKEIQTVNLHNVKKCWVTQNIKQKSTIIVHQSLKTNL